MKEGKQFFFAECKTNASDRKLSLQHVLSNVEHWFNPCLGIFGFIQATADFGSNPLATPKAFREAYATSLAAYLIQNTAGGRWWFGNLKPNMDPPDGAVCRQIKVGANGYEFEGREVEVVECREGRTPKEAIVQKLSQRAYNADTILICLVFDGGVYDLKELSRELCSMATSLEHIFVVFHGGHISKAENVEDLIFSFSMVQLKPVYHDETIDLREICKDWHKKEMAWFYIGEGKYRGKVLFNLKRPGEIERPTPYPLKKQNK